MVHQMEESGKFLESMMAAYGINQAQMAKEIGTTVRTLYNWTMGRVPRSRFGIISDKYRIPVSVLIRASHGVPIPSRYLERQNWTGMAANVTATHDTGVAIPTFDLPISASHWSELLPDAETLTLDARVIDQGRFRVIVRGHCMEPKWKDGYRVEFQIVRLDTDGLPVGKDVCVTTSDHESTFKTLVRFDKSSDELVLRARNRKFPQNLRVPQQMVTRIAIAVGRFTPEKEV